LITETAILLLDVLSIIFWVVPSVRRCLDIYSNGDWFMHRFTILRAYIYLVEAHIIFIPREKETLAPQHFMHLSG
ncbi:hypothetical protein ACJX0J_024748, partial [Zea mays]